MEKLMSVTQNKDDIGGCKDTLMCVTLPLLSRRDLMKDNVSKPHINVQFCSGRGH